MFEDDCFPYSTIKYGYSFNSIPIVVSNHDEFNPRNLEADAERYSKPSQFYIYAKTNGYPIDLDSDVTEVSSELELKGTDL